MATDGFSGHIELIAPFAEVDMKGALVFHEGSELLGITQEVFFFIRHVVSGKSRRQARADRLYNRAELGEKMSPTDRTWICVADGKPDCGMGDLAMSSDKDFGPVPRRIGVFFAVDYEGCLCAAKALRHRPAGRLQRVAQFYQLIGVEALKKRSVGFQI